MIHNTIEYITFCIATGDAIDFGALTDARSHTAALGNPTRAVEIGGYDILVNTMDF